MTVTLKPKSEITVPKSIRRKAGIKAGDRFEFSVSGRVITILPKPLAADEYTPAQRRTVDRAIAKGLDDIKHGRLEGPFSSHKEFIDSLHKEAGKLGKKTTKRLVR
jgi:AbrB family looped-hinge helix DNA binding protein